MDAVRSIARPSIILSSASREIVMQLRAILRSALIVIVAAIVAAGCGGDGPSLPEHVAGRYRLISINGQPLPYVLPNTPVGTTARITEGRLTIEDNRDFAQVLVFNTVTADPNDHDGDTASQSSGTVVVDGETIRFEPRLEEGWSGQLMEGGLVYTRSAGGTPLQFAFMLEF
jgi:hypothetical protein